MSYYFFVSDTHLGLDNGDIKGREERFVSFLSSLPCETKAVYLLGDIFDFWWEYKYVVPRGYVRTLGKIAEIVDSGIEVFFFKGNHDMWTFGYLEEELGVKVLEQPQIVEIEDKIFCLGHGDGIGNTKWNYKLLLRLFRSHFLQRMLNILHPRWTVSLGYKWSKLNRTQNEKKEYSFKGEDEQLYKFAVEIGAKRAKEGLKPVDYYIFGHLHTPARIDTPNGGELIILGEWLTASDYLYFDGTDLTTGSGNFPNMER